jgi:hypothetical protein
VGASDHRELVPLGPLDGPDGGADRRAALALGVAGLQQIVDGGTGLYDTTLAAVRAVRRGWDPDRVNSVVLLTDGRNDDTDGIDLTTLLAELRAENDPQRPVPVISLVYGPDADAAALRAISDATGGATYSRGTRARWARSCWTRSVAGPAGPPAEVAQPAPTAVKAQQLTNARGSSWSIVVRAACRAGPTATPRPSCSCRATISGTASRSGTGTTLATRAVVPRASRALTNPSISSPS